MARADSGGDRPAVEVADVLRRHGEAYLRDHVGHLGRVERRVIGAITACRTGDAGRPCRGLRRLWDNACRLQLLPQPALPQAPGGGADEVACGPAGRTAVGSLLPRRVHATRAGRRHRLQNKAVVYAILFKTAIEAMTTLASNPRRLGAEIGGLAVLHTWGQAFTPGAKR